MKKKVEGKIEAHLHCKICGIPIERARSYDSLKGYWELGFDLCYGAGMALDRLEAHHLCDEHLKESLLSEVCSIRRRSEAEEYLRGYNREPTILVPSNLWGDPPTCACPICGLATALKGSRCPKCGRKYRV